MLSLSLLLLYNLRIYLYAYGSPFEYVVTQQCSASIHLLSVFFLQLFTFPQTLVNQNFIQDTICHSFKKQKLISCAEENGIFLIVILRSPTDYRQKYIFVSSRGFTSFLDLYIFYWCTWNDPFHAPHPYKYTAFIFPLTL